MSQSGQDNKLKGWFYRLLKRESLTQEGPRPSEPQSEICTLRVEESTNCNRTRYSFRRSMKKANTRVKNCISSISFRRSETTTDLPNIPTIIPSSDTSVAVQPQPVPALYSCCLTVSGNMHNANPPPVPARYVEAPPTIPQKRSINHRIPTDEVQSLSNYYWYWGPMSTSEAEHQLKHKPDGAFLVRDSSSASYLFTLSFRSIGKTMHARIEYSKGQYNLFGWPTAGFATVTQLIEEAVKDSERGIFCYSKKHELDCEFPVRLTIPTSKYTQVRSLKHLCKFVVRQCTNINDLHKLPIPTVLSDYLVEGPYF